MSAVERRLIAATFSYSILHMCGIALVALVGMGGFGLLATLIIPILLTLSSIPFFLTIALLIYVLQPESDVRWIVFLVITCIAIGVSSCTISLAASVSAAV